MFDHWFKKYLWFAFLINPILVVVGLTFTYQVLGIDTSRATTDMVPFLPYLLVRMLFVPILLIPFIGAFILLGELKAHIKKSNDYFPKSRMRL